MSVQKVVHLLPVPFEIAEIINSFLFKQIAEIAKEKKNKCMEIILGNCQIKRCFFSRIYEINLYSCEGWYIFYKDKEHKIQKILTGVNCTNCGNYISESFYDYHKNIICLCDR